MELLCLDFLNSDWRDWRGSGRREDRLDKSDWVEQFLQGWRLVIGRIAASFSELLAGDDVRRMKICDNDDCRWIFFDESRNRARRWCDDRACGNLLKVRRFRERQKVKG